MNTALQLYNNNSEALIAKADELGVQMTGTQRKLLKSEGRRAISELDGPTLTNDCAALLMGIFRDLGISGTPDAYDGARFQGVLREHFGRLSVTDVKQAFEMYVVGDLDRLLPDKFGHYNKFSATFYIQVLRAYRTLQLEAKLDVSGKTNLLLIEQENQRRDPAADKCEFLRLLKGIMVEIAEGQAPVWIMSDSAEWTLKKLKLIPEAVTPEPYEVDSAVRRVTRQKDSAVELGIRRSIEQGIVPEDVSVGALQLAKRRALYNTLRELGPEGVASRFDWLISQYEKRIAANG